MSRRFQKSFRPGQRGQYMVEFALTFVIFIFVILGVINLMLIAYNFNLGQRVSWEAARKAAVGASNAELANFIYDQFATQFFASPFMVSAIQFDRNSFVIPNNEFDRVQDTNVVINVGFRTGFVMFAQSLAVEASFPIQSQITVIQNNDNDRDGRFDTTTINARADNRPGDHDNDNQADITDTDDDNDGVPDKSDSGIVYFDPSISAYRIDTGFGARASAKINFGQFYARPIWQLTAGDWTGDTHCYPYYPRIDATYNSDSGPYPSFPQQIPRDRYAPNGSHRLRVLIDMSQDRNNNGWDDKWDM